MPSTTIEYQANQLEAADQLLRQLGVPGPYTLRERIKTIELSKAMVASRFKSPIHSCYTSIKEISNKICNEIYTDRLRQQYSYAGPLFFLDWRDEL